MRIHPFLFLLICIVFVVVAVVVVAATLLIREENMNMISRETSNGKNEEINLSILVNTNHVII